MTHAPTPVATSSTFDPSSATTAAGTRPGKSGEARGTVLHVIHMTGPGGAETVVLNLATGMGAHGWRSLVAIPDLNWLGGALSERGNEPILVPDQHRLRYLLGLVAAIRERGVDIVHAHLLGPASYASVAGLACGVPLVCTFHGSMDIPPPRLRETLRFRLISRASEKVVLVSEPLRDALIESGRVPPEKTAVILNGIDTNEFRPRHDDGFRTELGLDGDAFLIGALGNVRPAKDYFTFLRAAAVLSRNSAAYRFVVVGQANGELYEQLLRLRDELGLGERVTFAGFRPDPARVLNNLDALLVSSSSEGFSLATVQAMASGIPVVATRCGGPQQIIDDEREGLLVPVADPQSIAHAVERIRTEPGLRQRIVTGALARARSEFSIERTYGEYSALYESVLRGRA